MPRTPNYDFERKERERVKAAKKAEKQAEKQAAKAAAKDSTKPAEEKETAGQD